MENTDIADKAANIPVPKPKEKDSSDETSVTVDGQTVDAELIMALINSTDENGHTPCAINVTMENIKNILEGKPLSEYTEEDRDYIDGVDISECSADLHSFDGDLMNLVLTFDSARDSYLRELNELCNRYRIATDELTVKNSMDHAIALTVTIVPNDLRGRGAVTLALPTLFCRVLSDDNENASMLLQFHMDSVDFYAINISEEEAAEITADVLRQNESGTGGNLFTENTEE